MLKSPERSLTLIALSSLLFLSSSGGSQLSSQVSMKESMCVCACVHIPACICVSVSLDSVCLCQHVYVCVHV